RQRADCGPDMTSSVEDLNLVSASNGRSAKRAAYDVVDLGGGGFVVRQGVPIDSLAPQLLALIVRSPPPRLERPQRHARPAGGKGPQVGQDLRLHERLAQAEVADVEGAGHRARVSIHQTSAALPNMWTE